MICSREKRSAMNQSSEITAKSPRPEEKTDDFDNGLRLLARLITPDLIAIQQFQDIENEMWKKTESK